MLKAILAAWLWRKLVFKGCSWPWRIFLYLSPLTPGFWTQGINSVGVYLLLTDEDIDYYIGQMRTTLKVHLSFQGE